VRSHGVVAAEVGQQLVVEGADVVGQQVFVVGGEFLLHGAVEALVSGVHFRATRVGVVMSPTLRAGEGVKRAGEFAAVIGEDLLDVARGAARSTMCWSMCGAVSRSPHASNSKTAAKKPSPNG